MTITASYKVDNELYLLATTKRNPTLITTEYTHKNNMLVHTQMNKNTAIRANNMLEANFRLKRPLDSELYFSKKTYSKGSIKPITKGNFEQRLNKFPKGETSITKEILEQYDYCDKNGKSDELQIVITQSKGKMTAVIDFKNAQQYEDFVAPSWLSRYEE